MTRGLTAEISSASQGEQFLTSSAVGLLRGGAHFTAEVM